MSSKSENDQFEGVSSSVHIPEDTQLPPPVSEVNTTTAAEIVSQPTESSPESPANYLLITDPADSQSNTEDLKFHNFNSIGMFSINENKSYSEEETQLLHIPKLLSEVPDLRGIELVGPEFGEAFKTTPTPIQEKAGYEILHKWLIDTNYFQKVQEKVYKKPDFICFGTLFAFPMTLHLQKQGPNYKIYAAQYMDSIFIWTKSYASPKTLPKKEIEKKLRVVYYQNKFKFLLTDADGSVCQNIHDFKDNFAIQEVTFGTHQLLVASRLSAYENNVAGDKECNRIHFRNFYEVNPKSEYAYRQKCVLQERYLQCWADCTSCGIKKVVVGLMERDSSCKITGQFIMNMDQVLKESGKRKETVQQTYEFQNRFLYWVKGQFKENNPNVVKQFWWNNSKSDRVECSDTDVKYLSVEGMIPFTDDFGSEYN